MIKTCPHPIRGPWAEGWVLDVHSTGSEFVGYDESNHEVFDTHRTEVGELLYRLKYRQDESALAEIGVAGEDFIRAWAIEFDVIVPAPPSRFRRVQPVQQIADELARRLDVIAIPAVKKRSAAPAELERLHDVHEREAALQDVLVVDPRRITGKRVLLVDDLIRSGATLRAVANMLTLAEVAMIFAFALTKTRRS